MTRSTQFAFALACLSFGASACGDQDALGPECVGGSDAHNEYSVRLDGTGFEAYEGLPVHVVAGIGLVSGGRCRAANEAQIAGGAFSFQLINRTDDAVYPVLGSFLDLDRDGFCSAAMDLTWIRNSSVLELEVVLEPANFSTDRDQDVCVWFEPWATPRR